MVHKDPLSRFPAVRTRDPDELQERLSSLYAVRSVELLRNSKNFTACVNHRELQSVGLTYGRYGSALEAILGLTNFYVQGFPIRGRGEAVVDGRSTTVSKEGGLVGGPGALIRLKYSADFKHLILKIRPEALIKKLSALIGNPVNTPLKPSGQLDGPALEAERRLLQFAITEIDRADGTLSALFLAELEQALIVAFLCSNQHNYSHWLSGPLLTVAPWQVRRAEEYIEENWNQPITIEALAFVANTSARSLFSSFKKSRGCSPMSFVKQVRMRHAKAMLTTPEAETSVTSVAFACGFSNLGHFAKAYFQSFGELPSETLRAKKGSRAI